MTRRRRYTGGRGKFLLGIIGIMMLGGVTACKAPSDEPREIPIGVIAPLSGNIPNVGQSTVDAAKLAVQAVNDAGGLRIGEQRHKVVLRIEDNQDNPAEAVRVASKLLNEHNVVALVGPQASRNAIPVARGAEEAQVPMVTPWSTNPETTLGKRYVFRVAGVDDLQGRILARFVQQDLHRQRVAVLYDVASAYNKALAEIFKQAFEAAGGQVVAFETYTTGEEDFNRQLARIRDKQPDLIFLPNYGTEIPNQVRQARQIGITAPFIGGDTWFTIDPEARSALEGFFFSAYWAPDVANEQAQAFMKTYRQSFNRDADDVAALTYDAFGLLFQAIRGQGSVARDAIRTGLADMTHYEGVTGTIGYHETGDPERSAMILQIKQGENIFHKLVNP